MRSRLPVRILASAALGLARRFAAGATMWCVAPQWPAHSLHMAVEFVHPVIVGTRALPARHVESSDATTTLRLVARPGDVVAVLSAAGDPCADDLLRRAEAWGLTRLVLGAGPRAGSPRAEHVLWVEGNDAEDAAHSGDLMLLYHLLWELTHVALEHPGLLGDDAPACGGEGCLTCSDRAEVGEVRAVRDGGSAQVVVHGVPVVADVSLVGPLDPGDLVLVHAGVALATLADQVDPDGWGAS